MLSVGLIFLYVMLTAYLVGFLILKSISRFCTGRKKKEAPEVFWRNLKADSYIMAGLVGLTVYAQIFSLFYKVGLAANLLLIVICITILIIFRKSWKEEILQIRERTTKGKWIFYAILFLLFAYGTSRGIIHYDTGLYHAQSIRWMEEYGIVKGLGNLHCRLAYNSSAFSLSALFSFSFLGGQSYHCIAGFFAMIIMKVCSEVVIAWKRKKFVLSDFARIMAIYYLFIIFDEMISPASDYFTVLTIFYIIIRWLDLLERQEQSWIPYGLLCLLGVYTMSLKLSAALILILVIKPAVCLIRKRNFKGIFSFLGLGLFIIAPYIIRNVVISGWLVYPFTFIDFFPVDWKIPKGIADYDAKEIQVWGRGIYDVTRFEEPISVWFRTWFLELGTIDKIFILSSIASIFIFLIAAIYVIIKRKKEMYDWLLITATVDFSFLFWLFSAPLIRYGCVYVWLASAVTLGGLSLYMIQNRKVWKVIYGVIGLLVCYKVFAFGKEVITACENSYFIVQKDYDNYEVAAYEMEGITFYYPVEGDRVGYEAFPSSPTEAEIILRGKDLKDGFSDRNTNINTY